MKTIYLIRHAQSHPTSRLPDNEWPLSDRGQEQAQQLAEILPLLGIEEVFSSPYLRCRQTIEPFCRSSGVDLKIVEDLRERLIVRTFRKDFLRIWKKSWEDFDFALDGCESCRTCQRRIVKAVHGLAQSTDSSTIAAVSHGNTIALLLNHLDPDFDRCQAEQLRNPDILQLDFDGRTFHWKRELRLPQLDKLATDFRETPISWE